MHVPLETTIEIGSQIEGVESCCKQALEKIPENSTGIVLGAGRNTEEWREKGWKTLDIDSKHGADFVGDANRLSEIIPKNSLDFVFAEAIPSVSMRENHPGVNEKTLVAESAQVLKPGGYLIIKAPANEGGDLVKGIKVQDYIEILEENNFHGIAEQSEVLSFKTMGESGEESGSYRSVMYYAKKG
jgi:predicted SAM-dependent methyltransferase